MGCEEDEDEEGGRGKLKSCPAEDGGLWSALEVVWEEAEEG